MLSTGFGTLKPKAWVRNNPQTQNLKPADIRPETESLSSLDMRVAVEPEATTMLFAETVVETKAIAIQVAGRFISNDYGIILTKDEHRAVPSTSSTYYAIVHSPPAPPLASFALHLHIKTKGCEKP